ncbi:MULTISPECIES: hypothetical protein [unclassified Nocardioides]|uniref:hypothetical protein n=1 Tax=unclassified Nocardioides TaxID=2615069 RepID=UPI00070127AC|nr:MULTISPECIES: hypothetical protein [unclassified Nocardioides]KRA37916.1 hypothetical protein ASD81_04320 [Nocardioides sp. Root614]KRA91876.1 hypothetical protein ASD84_04585 [Nocardioides sp. Root682]
MRVQSRRTDVFPTTWEIPVGIGLVWLLGAFLAFPAGQGLAYAVRGDGFVWPGPELGHSLLGLLEGDVGRGISPDIRATAPHPVPVYAAVVVLELALVSAAVIGLSWWWRTVGPLAQFGMASRHEVFAVLGRRQLMRRGATVRPDLVEGRQV